MVVSGFLRARFKTSVRGAAFLTSTLRQLGQQKNARTFGRTVDKLYNCSRHKCSSTKSVRIRGGGVDKTRQIKTLTLLTSIYASAQIINSLTSGFMI